MNLSSEDLAAIRLIVREEIGAVPEKSASSAATLPEREILPGEVNDVLALIPGAWPEMLTDLLKYRAAADLVVWLQQLMANFGTTTLHGLPHVVESGSMTVAVRDPGPCTLKPADPLPGDPYGVGV